jgi:hypothetical protein
MDSINYTVKPVFSLNQNLGNPASGLNQEAGKNNPNQESKSDQFLGLHNNPYTESVKAPETIAIPQQNPLAGPVKQAQPANPSIPYTNRLNVARAYGNYQKPLDVDQVTNQKLVKQQAYIQPHAMNAFAQTEERNKFEESDKAFTKEINYREELKETLFKVVPEAIRNITPEYIYNQIKIFKNIYEENRNKFANMIETPAGKMTLSGIKRFIDGLVTRSEQLLNARNQSYSINRQPVIV